MRYTFIHSGMPSGSYSDFTAANDEDAVAEATALSAFGGHRVISLAEIISPHTHRAVSLP